MVEFSPLVKHLANFWLLLIAVIFGFFWIQQVSASPLNYKCAVQQVQSSSNDAGFIQDNLRKTFLITILDNQIIASQSSSAFEPSQDSYTIVARNLLGIHSVNLSAVGLGTLSIENSQHRNDVQATVTIQGTFFVNVWNLKCKKT